VSRRRMVRKLMGILCCEAELAVQCCNVRSQGLGTRRPSFSGMDGRDMKLALLDAFSHGDWRIH